MDIEIVDDLVVLQLQAATPGIKKFNFNVLNKDAERPYSQYVYAETLEDALEQLKHNFPAMVRHELFQIWKAGPHLDEMQVGDLALLHSFSGWHEAHVTHTTKHHIMVKESGLKFRRNSGEPVGEKRFLSTPYLSRYDEQTLSWQAEKKERDQLSARFSEIGWKNIDIFKLRRIAAILDEQ